MTKHPPIPPRIWQRILAFLRDGLTGQIVLDVHRGTVRSADVRERVREDDEAVQSDRAVVN